MNLEVASETCMQAFGTNSLENGLRTSLWRYLGFRLVFSPMSDHEKRVAGMGSELIESSHWRISRNSAPE